MISDSKWLLELAAIFGKMVKKTNKMNIKVNLNEFLKWRVVLSSVDNNNYEIHTTSHVIELNSDESIYLAVVTAEKEVSLYLAGMLSSQDAYKAIAHLQDKLNEVIVIESEGFTGKIKYFNHKGYKISVYFQKEHIITFWEDTLDEVKEVFKQVIQDYLEKKGR